MVMKMWTRNLGILKRPLHRLNTTAARLHDDALSRRDQPTTSRVSQSQTTSRHREVQKAILSVAIT
jgi:hypothetical protein